jgi:putative ABC transport system substrate-binding protein
LANVLFVSTQGAWDDAGGQATRSVAEKLGISLVPATLNAPYDEAECRRVLSSVQRDQLDGVVVSFESHLFDLYSLLVQLIQQMRLPAIYPLVEHAKEGGLMAYTYDINFALRTQAAQAVEILRGANPGDMPYVQATRFEFVINLRTARELGLKIPRSPVRLM